MVTKVLLFPPVNNFRRFLIHQSCENFRQQYDLFTFSVGQGPFRRTVVCFKNQLLDPSKFTDTATAANFETRNKQSPVKSWRRERRTEAAEFLPTSSHVAAKRTSSAAIKMGVEKNLNETRYGLDNLPYSLSSGASATRAPRPVENSKLLSKSNSVDLYRPPALRNIISSSADLSHTAGTMTGALTAGNKIAAAATNANGSSPISNTTSISCNSSPVHVNGNAQSDHATAIVMTSRNAREALPSEIASTDAQSPLEAATTSTRRERRPDRAVYIPRARRSQTTPPTAAVAAATTTTTTTIQLQQAAPIATATAIMMSSSTSSGNSCGYQQQLAITSDTTAALVSNTPSPKSDEVGKSASRKSKSSSSNKERKERSIRKSVTGSAKDSKSPDKTIAQNDSESSKVSDNHLNCDNDQAETASVAQSEQRSHANEMNVSHKKASNAKVEVANLRIEDAVGPNTRERSRAKCDIDEQELQRASKEINRSNRRIMKQSFVSDVLEIPEKIEQQRNGAVERKKRKNVTPSILQNPSVTGSTTEEEEDDDWENIYNESGDCLDPKIMQELTASVGKVKIELPKMDYSAYLTKQAILNEEEFPHVLEVSNFPVEFKNQDLLMVFSQYKESGFDIKWVDDTHALAVFSSSRIAAEVLTMGHPFVVLKPLADATVESRLKAKKCAASLQPYRPRPETCAALARRLVTGALGVRLETAAAERENEKRVLREAKERKLLAAKQRDEIWES